MRRALQTGWGRFVAVSRQLFRRREFVVRSDGQLRYVVLSTPHQAAMASVGILLTGWLVYSSGSLLLRDIRLSEIRQAKATYLDLLAEVGEADAAFATLSGEAAPGELVLPELAPREDGATVDAASAEGSAQAASAEGPAKRSEAELALITTGREALQADLRRFGADLQTITDRNRELKGNIAALNRELQTVVGEKAQVVATRERLSGELEGAEAELAKATERHDLLASSLQTLEERVAAMDSGSANGKAVLNWQIANLKQQLSDTRDDKATLENRVRSIVGSLSGMIGERDTLQTARAELREQVEDVEERLDTLQESQDAIVQGLVDRARGGVDAIEKTVAMTGLDVEMLLSRTENPQQGTGGPFVPLDQQQVGDEILLASVADLDDTVRRWERLQAILRNLPLTSPVDSYWVASLFGPRKDPVTSRRAMHEGVDLAGPIKAPVLSTGPGRVTFAGRNGGYGRMVEIDHGLGITTRYGHMHSILVSVGDMVDYRDRIGLLGSTGRSTGPHVHYEIRVDGKPQDPMNFLKAGRYVFKG